MQILDDSIKWIKKTRNTGYISIVCRLVNRTKICNISHLYQNIISKMYNISNRNLLKYVPYTDKKELANDLKTVYQASTEELAYTNLLELEEK